MHGFTIAFVFSYFCSYDVVSGSFKVCAMKSKPKIRFHYWAFCLFLSFSSIFVYVCVCAQFSRKIEIVRKRINHHNEAMN